jgi:hypothetical protein
MSLFPSPIPHHPRGSFLEQNSPQAKRATSWREGLLPRRAKLIKQQRCIARGKSPKTTAMGDTRTRWRRVYDWWTRRKSNWITPRLHRQSYRTRFNVYTGVAGPSCRSCEWTMAVSPSSAFCHGIKGTTCPSSELPKYLESTQRAAYSDSNIMESMM